MKRAKKAAAFLLSVLAAAAVLTVTVPAPGLAQQVRTLSTGAGKDARIPHKDYSLKLVFAQRAGPFVGGVKVAIYDQAGGKVLETVSAGPWLFVDLPAGSYRVVAQMDGARAAGTVEVSAARQKALYLTW